MPEISRHNITNAAEIDQALKTQDWRIDYIFLVPHQNSTLQWCLGEEHRGQLLGYFTLCKITTMENDKYVYFTIVLTDSKTIRYVSNATFYANRISRISFIFWKIIDWFRFGYE